MVQADTEKLLKNSILLTDASLILLDLIDERFDLFERPNGEICTLSNELVSSGFDGKLTTGKVIKSGTNEFISRWLLGWEKLLSILVETNNLKKLRINRVFWSDGLEDGGNFLSHFSKFSIYEANNLLSILYSHAERSVSHNQFINFDSYLFKGSVRHKWGVSPFHYTDHFYIHVIKKSNRAFRLLR